jgi:solute carrier family 24 (sodium/potassium/calcium exchanger), member 6
MLNILLGIGGAGTYVIASTGRPYPVQVSPTLWVSAFGLIILLITTLCFVPYNGFLISRRWGWFLIAFYCVLTVMNIVIEIRHGRK